MDTLAASETAPGWGGLRQRFSEAMENPTILGFLFVAPAELLLLIFLAYPFLLGLWLGFTNTILGGKGEFVGFNNYAYLLSDPTFRLAVFNSFFYTVVAVILKAILGIGLAVGIPGLFRRH